MNSSPIAQGPLQETPRCLGKIGDPKNPEICGRRPEKHKVLCRECISLKNGSGDA